MKFKVQIVLEREIEVEAFNEREARMKAREMVANERLTRGHMSVLTNYEKEKSKRVIASLEWIEDAEQKIAALEFISNSVPWPTEDIDKVVSWCSTLTAEQIKEIREAIYDQDPENKWDWLLKNYVMRAESCAT